MEEWRDIPYYEGLYQVSDMGNVRSLNYNHTGKIQTLKPEKNKGYLLVVLCKDGNKKGLQVHRLVATAFLENPDNLPQVNHKNEITTDNKVENLEWCDCKYNVNYGTGVKRRAETIRGVPRTEETKRKMSKALKGRHQSEEEKRKKSIPVAQYSKEGELIAIYYAGIEASRQTGIANSHIADCCKGKYKSAGGYIWKYVNQ